MANEPVAVLVRVALFSSVAILLLLCLRTPLRRHFGAALAYLAWLNVPLVALSALLPARAAPQVFALALQPVQALAAHALPPASGGHGHALLLAWGAGAIVSVLWFVHGHLGFVRHAGRLTRRGAVYLSAAGAGPASVGLLRPKIVLPHDFAERYTLDEQALVIAHEQVHIARRDALANLAAALFQCLFWFNPLVHLGVRRMRQDQELACDAAVMARHPQRRRTYAEALLKCYTGAASAAGMHCHWQSTHPTKERIMSLQQTVPGTLGRLAGRCLLALLAAGAVGATVGVRAQQATTAPSYSIAMAIDTTTVPQAPFRVQADAVEANTGNGAKTPRVVTAAGSPFSVASDGWRVDMTVRPAETPDGVWLAGKVYRGEELVSTPTLLSRIGQRATIAVGDSAHPFTMSMVVTPQP